MSTDDSPIPSWLPVTRIREGVTVRLLSPLGVYPTTGFCTSDAAMVVGHDICALITCFRPVKEPENYYSEVEFLSPYEIRLLAAVLLSRRPDSGALCLYPVEHEMVVRQFGPVDFSDAATIGRFTITFRALLKEHPSPYRLKWTHRPPLLGGRPYDFNEAADLRLMHQHAIFLCLDVTDHLMLRGLSSLIRGYMLCCFGEFREYAGMAFWVAMEASLELVKRILRTEEGMVNPTAKDAGEYLDDMFENEWDSEGYFIDYYEDRIKTIHPASRYGIFPGAPIGYDDVWSLGEHLVHLYDFLVTGEIPVELKGR